MAINRDIHSQKHESSQNKRLTIGLLIEDIAGKGKYQSAIWSGIAKTAQKKGVNLISFVGGQLKGPNYPGGNENIIYSLVDGQKGETKVDGLIISGTLATHITPEEFNSFCRRYGPIPVVTIAAPQKGIPSILSDNEKGMEDAIMHLIKEHGRNRIAFICGPKVNPEARIRFEAYKNSLAKNRLSFDHNLVVEGGDFFPGIDGETAIKTLLDERKVEFDAIIAANDYLALGAIKALEERGKKIPDDMIIIGFDDIEEAKANTPSLTTVRQQLHKQGKRAVEVLLELIETGQVKDKEISPLTTDLVKRQSCGCEEIEAVDARTRGDSNNNKTIENILIKERRRILTEIIKAIESSRSELSIKKAVRLLDALYNDLQGKSSGTFLKALDSILRQSIEENSDVDAVPWQNAITIIRREILTCNNDERIQKQTEILWHEARIMIAKAAQQVELTRRLQTERQAINLREIGEKLITTVAMQELLVILAEELKKLEIPCCYIFLYDRGAPKQTSTGQDELPECSRLMLKYDINTSRECDKSGQIFNTKQLIANIIKSHQRLYSMVIEPLYVQDEQLGFIIFEMGPKKGIIYEYLRGQISSSLKGALLVQEVQKGSERIKRANDTAKVVAEVIVQEDLNGTLKTIAQGTMDVLGCDAVTLYSYDQTTNKLGCSPTMVGVNYPERASSKKEVEDGSLVYTIFQKREPYIIAKTAENSIFKELRFTRDEKIESCAGIPLEAAGQKVGVMFVNYRTQHYFTGDELDDIKLYAHHAAAAIRNAQLFEIAARGKKYLEALYKAGQAVTSTLALDEILQRIVDQAQLITGYYREPARFSQIAIIDGNKLQIKAMSPQKLYGELMDSKCDYYKEWVSEERRGIIGRVADTGKSELVNNVDLDDDYKKCDPGTHSELAVPIKIGDQVIGIINVEHSQYEAFQYEDLNYLESLAAQAAIAIRNARTYEDLKRTQGLIAGRTALAWMGMASSAWRHSADKYALTIRETAQLLRMDGERESWLEQGNKADERISTIESLATRILEKPITPPLSSESGLESVSITALVSERAKQLWQNEPYKKVSLTMELQLSESSIVRANSEWLIRAFDLLVDNAVKAVDNSPESRIIIGTRPGTDGCEILIQDNGPGIPKEIQDKIGLEKIEKPEDAKGLGMGLLIAQTIIQTYGGNIRIGSTSPAGTIMVIALPLEQGK